MDSLLCNSIFDQSINDYHKTDSVDAPLKNPHPNGSIESLLYRKNWIDTVQWHLEDIIRRPDLETQAFIATKRRIDLSNQDRTDTVEVLDDRLIEMLSGSTPKEGARMNTETPAWVLDRLSILALKLYHMREQTERPEAAEDHKIKCGQKLAILEEQRADLSRSFDELLEDIRAGIRFTKVYRQMKMYNDSSLNPQLYSGSQKSKTS